VREQTATDDVGGIGGGMAPEGEDSMRFRVHVTTTITYEVEAESEDDARGMFGDDWFDDRVPNDAMGVGAARKSVEVEPVRTPGDA
jgi:hypothetical protein